MEITVDLLEFVLAAADNWGGAGGAYRDRCRRGVYRSNNDDSAAAAAAAAATAATAAAAAGDGDDDNYDHNKSTFTFY